MVEWAEDRYVRKVRIFGTGPEGAPFEKTVTYSEPELIYAVADVVARINRGQYRPA